MNVDTWYWLTGFILCVQFGVAFYFLFWLRGTLPPQVLNKYSIGGRIAGITQLGTTWKSQIESSDLVSFAAARKGFLRVILFLVITVGIQAALLTAIVFT